MYKQDYGKYFNKNRGKTPKEKTKYILGQIWKWTKVLLILFLILSMLWGCVQMTIPKYTASQVTDMLGNKVYSPGTSFEIVISSLKDNGYKTHWFQQSSSSISEITYTQISSWGDAFSIGKSPYYGFFVYPIAFVLVGFLRLFSGLGANGYMDSTKSNYGISAFFAIILTAMLSRVIVLMSTFKAQKNQERMQNMTSKQAEIQAKYKGKKDAVSRQKQQMETMELYKKEGISPFSAIVSQIATMPFLFAMYAVVRSSHALRVAQMGQIKFVEMPWQQVKAGHWVYFSLLATYLPLQTFSMFLPMILQAINQKGKVMSEQQKKSRKKQLIIQIVISVVFVFVVASVPAGVAIYWIFTSTWQICQTLGFHYARQLKGKKIKAKRQKNKIKRITKTKKENVQLIAAKKNNDTKKD